MKSTKFFLSSIVLLVMVLAFSLQADAALQNLGTDSLGNRLIYDTDFDITWYDYSNAANTWQNQMDWADGLTIDFGGSIIDAWRLPTAFNQDGTGPCVGYNCTDNEMGHLYYTELGNVGMYDTTGEFNENYGLFNTGDFQNLQADVVYWSGTEQATNHAYAFTTNAGHTNCCSTGSAYSYGMAVMDGLAVVPEPISSILFIAGGATLGFRRFRKKITN